MSDETTRRSGRSGGIIVALVVGGSAVGVGGWYMMTNRGGAGIDASGFDLSTAPQSSRPAPVASAPSRPQPAQASSLDMMKGDAGVRIGSDANNAPPPAAHPAGGGKEPDKKDQSHSDFTEQARKHEGDVRKFAERMTRQNPIIKQYGKDWMSHPDLKKLNDDYMRNHDPVAFIMGLTKAPSLGGMVKQYAGNPAIISFITQGMKEAPGELTGAAMDVLANDGVAKNLVSNIASGLGLPPSITGMISGGGDPSKIDKAKIVNDMTTSAMQQQGQQPPPAVPLQQ